MHRYVEHVHMPSLICVIIVFSNPQMQHVWFNSLSILLQFAVHPPVSLIGDEQDDDVSLVKAQQRAVVAGSVGEDGAHTWPLHYIVEACGNRHRPGKIVLLAVSVVWEGGRKKGKGEESLQEYKNNNAIYLW